MQSEPSRNLTTLFNPDPLIDLVQASSSGYSTIEDLELHPIPHLLGPHSVSHWLHRPGYAPHTPLYHHSAQ